MQTNPFIQREHAERYADLRSIPQAMLEGYVRLILRSCNAPMRIADVGSGAGQFTVALASALPTVTIDSFEPAPAMREAAARLIEDLRLSNVHLRPTRFEEFSGTDTYDLILLSEVIHLFADPLALLDKLVAHLKPHGTIAIRTSSQSQLRARDWYRFFPRALLIDMRRHPPLELLVDALRFHGLLVSEIIFDESRALPANRFAALLTDRGFSTLYLISDAEFGAGCARMAREVLSADTYYYDYKMTLLLARGLT